VSSSTSGRNAVRLAVLLVVVAASLTWARLDRPDGTVSMRPTADVFVPPAEQQVAAGATLTPAPAPAAQSAAQVRRAHHAHGHRAKPHRHHRKAQARRAARHQGKKGHHKHHPKHHGKKAHAKHHAKTPVRARGGGRDIGWPQCSGDLGFRGHNGRGQPMPDPGVKFVIVGLTNGRSFTPNPCLDRHLSWVRNHHVHAAAYAFGTYPTRAQVRRYRHNGPYDGRGTAGALANAGHAAARYNIRLMQRHGFTTPHIWLDVEHSSTRPWSGRPVRNGSVVRGWVRAYRNAGYSVGFYSTTSIWRDIVGRLRFGLPEWRTAGPASPRAALGRCRERGFQGGRAVVSQWWTTHRDFDRLCPAPSRDAVFQRYFHKW